MPLTPGNTALTVMTYNVGKGLADLAGRFGCCAASRST